MNHMVWRGAAPGPFFLFDDGHFMARLRQAIAAAGLFRIGVATTAARMGIHDLLIQNLGRWQSAAYMRYVRTSAACS